MSLILSIPTPQGVILASDSQFSVGQARDSVPRVSRLNSRICWAGTGEYALIQRVGQGLLAFQDSQQTLREIVPAIAGTIKAAVKDLLASDFRTEFFINNIGALSQLHRADFVFAEFGQIPVIVHLNVLGSPVWVHDRPFFVGPGDALAGAQFVRYRELSLTLGGAAIVACRLLEDAIESGIFGLAGPVDLWQISAAGVEQLGPRQRQTIQDSVKAIREHELAVFEKHLMLSVSH